VFPNGNLLLSFRALEITDELATVLQGEEEHGVRVLSKRRRGDAERG
jgi:hypothetical protein